MTFSGLSQDFLKTSSGLSLGFLKTFLGLSQELSQDFLRNFSGLSLDSNWIFKFNSKSLALTALPYLHTRQV